MIRVTGARTLTLHSDSVSARHPDSAALAAHPEGGGLDGDHNYVLSTLTYVYKLSSSGSSPIQFNKNVVTSEMSRSPMKCTDPRSSTFYNLPSNYVLVRLVFDQLN